MKFKTLAAMALSVAGLAAGQAHADAAADKAKAISEAAPYIKAALTTPMADLYKDAEEPDGFDMLRLGLAMFAGRMPVNPYADKDDAALAELEARVLPLSDAYFGAHPGVDYKTVDWEYVLHVTAADKRLVSHYQRFNSADYWLTRANIAVKSSGFVMSQRPNGFSGMENTPTTTRGTVGRPIVDHRVLLTAAQCVRAVRVAAGAAYHGPRDLPMSILLLRFNPGADLDRTLQAPSSDPAQAVGADACGTTETFDGYVAALKAAP